MKKLFPLLLILTLTACAGPQNMAFDRGALPTLTGKSVALVTRDKPTFVAMTSGKGMFAVAGVGAAAVAGNALVKESNIEDPAPKIGALLSQSLGTDYGMKINGQPGIMADSNSLNDIVELAKGSDYALDVATNGWSFIYDGFKFSEYLVGYSVKLRLIEVAGAREVAKGYCAYDTKTAGLPNVSYETLLANDAAYIKQTLDDATSFCVDKLKSELF